MRSRLAPEPPAIANCLPEMQVSLLEREEERLNMFPALPIPTARTQILPFERPYVDNPKRPFFSNPEFYIIPKHGPLSDIEAGTPAKPSIQGSEFVTPIPSVSNQTDAENSLSVELLPRGPMSPQLRERLMGKAPLRLIVGREPQFVPPATQPKYWVETLECSHVQTAFPGFYWDEGGHLINVQPTAKRRRCQPCKALELGKKFLPQSVKPEKKKDEESA